MTKSLNKAPAFTTVPDLDSATVPSAEVTARTQGPRVRVADDIDLAAAELGKETRNAVGSRSTRIPPRRALPRRQRVARVHERRNARKARKDRDLPNGIFKNPVYPYPRDPLGKIITFIANVLKVFVRLFLGFLGARNNSAQPPPPTPQTRSKGSLDDRGEATHEAALKAALKSAQNGKLSVYNDFKR